MLARCYAPGMQEHVARRYPQLRKRLGFATLAFSFAVCLGWSHRPTPQIVLCPDCTCSLPSPATQQVPPNPPGGAPPTCRVDFTLRCKGGACMEGTQTDPCVPNPNLPCQFEVTTACNLGATCCPFVGAQGTGGPLIVWICNTDPKSVGTMPCGNTSDNSVSITFFVSASTGCTTGISAGNPMTVACSICSDGI